MFYSFDEIAVMSRAHGEDLQKTHRNYKKKKPEHEHAVKSKKAIIFASLFVLKGKK